MEMNAMTTKQLIRIVALACCAWSWTPVMAHGTGQALHGGVVRAANDIQFEMVSEADGATIYLVDHDKPMASAGISGKLTVLQGGQKSEAELKPAGDNKLKASGVSLGKGAKVVAVLHNVAGKTVTLRFALK
jgi:hypothetical protein